MSERWDRTNKVLFTIIILIVFGIFANIIIKNRACDARCKRGDATCAARCQRDRYCPAEHQGCDDE